MSRLVRLALVGVACVMAACGTGVDAGGESLGENGGVAFILMAVMLMAIGGLLWWIIGRDE